MGKFFTISRGRLPLEILQKYGTWGALPVGASGTVAITVAINTSVTDGTILHNAATIDSIETHPVSTQQSVPVTGIPSLLPSTCKPIPTLGTWMKLMLSLLLFAVASYSISRRKA